MISALIFLTQILLNFPILQYTCKIVCNCTWLVLFIHFICNHLWFIPLCNAESALHVISWNSLKSQRELNQRECNLSAITMKQQMLLLYQMQGVKENEGDRMRESLISSDRNAQPTNTWQRHKESKSVWERESAVGQWPQREWQTK